MTDTLTRVCGLPDLSPDDRRRLLRELEYTAHVLSQLDAGFHVPEFQVEEEHRCFQRGTRERGTPNLPLTFALVPGLVQFSC